MPTQETAYVSGRTLRALMYIMIAHPLRSLPELVLPPGKTRLYGRCALRATRKTSADDYRWSSQPLGPYAMSRQQLSSIRWTFVFHTRDDAWARKRCVLLKSSDLQKGRNP